jgi:hypothetical protein
MLIIFCADPLNNRKPDPEFLAEYSAAGEAGLERALISLETLIYSGDAAGAVRGVPRYETQVLAVYRGWMLKPEQYSALYKALDERGVQLINDPAAYRHTHHLPESYPVIEPYTPRSVWLPVTLDTPIGDILDALAPFGDGPVIVKDYVKSQKHYWHEACFIPSASNRTQAESVIRRLLELQGDDLNVGLVFRQFVDFEPLGKHAVSGMPTAREYRVFYLDGVPLLSSPYWEAGDDSGDVPPENLFADAAQQVQSRFFSMDVAKTRDGGWMIVELGDGQVAGLPTSVDPAQFYGTLYARLGSLKQQQDGQ